MIFNNYTIDEIIDYMNISYKEEFENNKYSLEEKNYSNIIFNRFYQQLYLLFDLKKDKKMVSNLYKDFDDLVEFNCSNLYKSIKYELLEAIDKILPNMELKEKLTEVCQFSQIFSTKDVKTIFERHFQYIKSGIITLKDFSYEGLNKHINDDIIGKVSFFFLSTTIYIIEVATSKTHIESIKKLHYIMSRRLLIMEIIYIIFGLVLVVIIIFFYFYNINELYKQIFLLKKAFNINKC
jgi:phosphopantetheine adenylyltransferase